MRCHSALQRARSQERHGRDLPQRRYPPEEGTGVLVGHRLESLLRGGRHGVLHDLRVAVERGGDEAAQQRVAWEQQAPS